MAVKHPYDRLGRIATPKEGMANCTTRADYQRRHTEQMTAKQRAFPELGIQLPWAAETSPVPFINGGKWVVVCECGDAPMASPDWDIARCFNCGAIYRKLAWPADRGAIESELLDRPNAITRTWLEGESIDDLREQNIARGITKRRG